MSHFKILVIGDNVEEQLAPYDENLTIEPQVDADWDYLSNLKNARSFYAEHPEHLPKKPNGDTHTLFTINDLDLLRDYNEGDDIREENGKYVRYTTYNPKSKWDYYVLGGRYNAWFKIKPGANPEDYHPSEPHWSENFGNASNHANASDQAMKRAIDFPAMVAARRAASEAEWAKLTEATKGILPPTFGWAECLDKHGQENIDAARTEWNTHPWNMAARKAGFWDAYEDFHMRAANPRAAYISAQEDFAATGFYGVVKDGVWFARGDMGWFGISNDKVSDDEWRAQVRELIEGLPDDTWLTNVDCHI